MSLPEAVTIPFNILCIIGVIVLPFAYIGAHVLFMIITEQSRRNRAQRKQRKADKKVEKELAEQSQTIGKIRDLGV